jgi:hypothetical protein
MAFFPVAYEQPTSQPARAGMTIIVLKILVFLLERTFSDARINKWAFAPAHQTTFLYGNGSFQAVLAMTIDRQPHN